MLHEHEIKEGEKKPKIFAVDRCSAQCDKQIAHVGRCQSQCDERVDHSGPHNCPTHGGF